LRVTRRPTAHRRLGRVDLGCRHEITIAG
jgi:hypothetical protein